MDYTISETLLRNLLMDAAELGAKKALVQTGLLKPFLSKSEAYKLHGRKIVDRWIGEGLVKLIKDGPNGAKMRIDRLELETVAKTSNRTYYYNHHR